MVYKSVFSADRGVDECFTAYNVFGNVLGNCGSNESKFVACDAKYVARFVTFFVVKFI